MGLTVAQKRARFAELIFKDAVRYFPDELIMIGRPGRGPLIAHLIDNPRSIERVGRHRHDWF